MLVFFFWSAFLAQGSLVLFLLLSYWCLGAGSSGMRAARISHVRSACEVGIGCAQGPRAANVNVPATERVERSRSHLPRAKRPTTARGASSVAAGHAMRDFWHQAMLWPAPEPASIFVALRRKLALHA